MIRCISRESTCLSLLLIATAVLPARADDAQDKPPADASRWTETRVGMGQVWSVELIPELRKHGFNGSLIHTYSSMTPAKLEAYLRVARDHGFDVMPTIRPEYFKDDSRHLRRLAETAAKFDNIWGWHCEKLTDEQIIHARDILGIENIIDFDNEPKPDPTRAIRYSRLWYPNLRANADKKESPVFGRVRPEILSSYPLYQIDGRVRPPLTWEMWLQACGTDEPEIGPATFRSYYIPPTEEIALYQVVMSSRAGAKAIWWYSLSVKVGPSEVRPLWEARPEIWKSVITASDFLLNGEAPYVRSTNRYLRYETDRESSSR